MIDLLSILIIFILTAIGSTLLPSLVGSGVTPLLTLFFIIGLVYTQKGSVPVLMAAFAGLLLDFLSPSFFGLYLGLFLLTAVTIRFLFQEGMNDISLNHYLVISLAALTVCLLANMVELFSQESLPNLSVILMPTAIFYGVNLLFAVLMYFLNIKYSDYVRKFIHYQKQR